MSRRKVTITNRVTPAEISAQLKELALYDFEAFCQYTGVDVVQVTICLERKKGLTLGQIASKLKLAKSTVTYRCNKCTNTSYGSSKKQM